MQYADGELSSRNAAQVRSHLHACWRCRAEIEDLQDTINQYVRYQQVIFDSPPAPPASWDGFEVRLDRRIAERQARPNRRGWLWAAALAAACFAIVVELRNPAPVRAAEILRKASEKEAAAVRPPRRIRIRTHDRTFVRGSGNAAEPQLQSLFMQAHYTWDDPLSASAFRAWRDSLADRHDEVAVQSGIYEVRTTTPSNNLEAATLDLRVTDLEVMGGTFRFRSSEFVEMTVLPDKPGPAAEPSPPEPQHPPAAVTPGAVGQRSAAVNPHAEELAVFAALHRAGADLGEQVELSRDTAGLLIVTATGITPARRVAIESSLSPLPDVTLRFQEPSIDLSRPTQADSTSANSAAPDSRDPVQARLQAALGTAAAVANLSDEVLEASEAALVQAHNLRELAGSFPPDVERTLDRSDLAVLSDLRSDHLRVLSERVDALQRALTPLLSSLGTPQGVPSQKPADSSNWQAATEVLFAATQRFDRLVTSLLTGGASDHPDEAIAATGRALAEWKLDLTWNLRY